MNVLGVKNAKLKTYPTELRERKVAYTPVCTRCTRTNSSGDQYHCMVRTWQILALIYPSSSGIVGWPPTTTLTDGRYLAGHRGHGHEMTSAGLTESLNEQLCGLTSSELLLPLHRGSYYY